MGLFPFVHVCCGQACRIFVPLVPLVVKILRIMLLSFLLLLAGLAIALFLFFQFSKVLGAAPTGERLARIRSSQYHRDGKFHNLVPTDMEMPAGTMLGVMWEFLKGGAEREPRAALPTVAFDREAWAAVPDSALAVSFFGHSALLLKVDGITVLCDPMFGERASMFPFMGPKRFPYSQPMSLDQLPDVDVVLLSHDHYDHLDHGSILSLKGRVRHWLTPLGVGAHLEHWGVAPESITEMDWWEGGEVGTLRFSLTPARHFSGRGLNDRFTTLWGSWVVEGRTRRVFFGADSGYSPTFREVGQRHGPFDLVLLECGAYNSRWADIHMMPEETARAAADLRAEVLMPIHWAAFSLAMHPWKEPVERLTAALEGSSVRLLTPRIGKVVVDADPHGSETWWREVE
jgi:L-ascorbate metabolism protein UlaG (beta-lactamase superfamily)